jgi:hypothetical protein
MGSTLPPRGSSASRSSRIRRKPCDRIAILPQACTPLQSLARESVHRVPARPLSRGFLPPQRHQPSEPPLPGLPHPGHVAPAHFLRATAPCSRYGLPGIFQPGALSGFNPSELSRTRIARPLDRTSPPAIDCLARVVRTCRTWFVSPVPDFRRSLSAAVSPVGCPGSSLRSFRDSSGSPTHPPASSTALSHARGLAAGVCSPCRLGHSASESLRRAEPWLSWVSPPWGLPSRPRDLDGRPASAAYRCRQEASPGDPDGLIHCRSGLRRAAMEPSFGHPLGHFRRGSRSGFLSLYSRVFKEPGIGFPLPRLASPCEVPVLVPPIGRFPGPKAGVGPIAAAFEAALLSCP